MGGLFGTLLVLATVLGEPMVLAQSPAPTPMPGMNPRGGPPASMVGAPVLTASGVIILGVLAASATAAWVRASRRLRRP